MMVTVAEEVTGGLWSSTVSVRVKVSSPSRATESSVISISVQAVPSLPAGMVIFVGAILKSSPPEGTKDQMEVWLLVCLASKTVQE